MSFFVQEIKYSAEVSYAVCFNFYKDLIKCHPLVFGDNFYSKGDLCRVKHLMRNWTIKKCQ